MAFLADAFHVFSPCYKGSILDGIDTNAVVVVRVEVIDSITSSSKSVYEKNGNFVGDCAENSLPQVVCVIEF